MRLRVIGTEIISFYALALNYTEAFIAFQTNFFVFFVEFLTVFVESFSIRYEATATLHLIAWIASCAISVRHIIILAKRIYLLTFSISHIESIIALFANIILNFFTIWMLIHVLRQLANTHIH